tara:strand:- start:72 stop:1118 length:1047 start_codon:yes stop_codon:yes gene_type:complete
MKKNRKELAGKKIGITGGTGSFGTTVLNELVDSDVEEIKILSRDEKKQDDLRKKLNDSRVKFIIGDVREKDSVDNFSLNLDYIFHAAALKQVPSCEFFPMEAFKTNVVGTSNVIDSAIKHEVERVICLSTDKAVYPINAMGLSKAMLEKVAVAKSRESNKTKVCVTRYGNVLASRGSVIPVFLKKIAQNKPLTLTDGSMTRFLMTLDEAVDLVFFAFSHGNNGDTLVQKSPASTMNEITSALVKAAGKKDYKIGNIGIRHGEKMYEVLLSREERAIAEDLGTYFRVPADNRDLNYEKYFSEGTFAYKSAEEYNSNNTNKLNEKQVYEILSNLPLLKEFKESGIAGEGF